MMDGARDILQDLQRLEALGQAEDEHEWHDFIMEHHDTWLRQGVHWWKCYSRTLAELVRSREEQVFTVALARDLVEEIARHDVDHNIGFLAQALAKVCGELDVTGSR